MKSASNSEIMKCYNVLHRHYGTQHWWPAETRLEMMLGAILTQNTAWTNVEKAISNLRKNKALSFQSLEAASREQIGEWIRPAGYFNQKSGYIKELVENIGTRFGGSLNKLFALETAALRKELLSWKGIGPETADSILLYAANRPVFVVDAYTKRVCLRHGWINEKARYDDVAKLFTDNLPADVQLYNEYHALIVQVCKDYCSARNPNCDECPLDDFLPTG